jgi:predicted nucleic acid-binding protein
MSDIDTVDLSAGSYFLDTNILVYSFDRTAPKKRAAARALIERALETAQGMISSQVVQEFINVATRKFAQPMNVSECREYLLTVLAPLCRHFPTTSFYDHALQVQDETRFAFYDAMIVTAAIESDCAYLLSEDMQHSRVIHGVTIINPFMAS